MEPIKKYFDEQSNNISPETVAEIQKDANEYCRNKIVENLKLLISRTDSFCEGRGIESAIQNILKAEL